MENNSLTHAGVKGMKWGVRKAEPHADTYPRQSRSSANPYTKAVSRNTVAAANRLSQMAIAGGLTYGAAKIAKARGKKLAAASLATIGTVTVAGLGGVMVSDFVRNNTRDIDVQHGELTHAGVKGMKWGVRRYQNKDGSLTPAGKKRYGNMSEDARTAATLKKKSVKSMSNAELKKLNERVRLEQEYSRLNPSAVKKGLAVAGGVAAGLGTVVALHNNGKQAIDIGKKVVGALAKKA